MDPSCREDLKMMGGGSSDGSRSDGNHGIVALVRLFLYILFFSFSQEKKNKNKKWFSWKAGLANQPVTASQVRQGLKVSITYVWDLGD